MSIQEPPVRYESPDQTTSSSSIVINRGSEEYDPYAVDEDDDNNNLKSMNIENERLNQKQESIRINNGTPINPVINNTNVSSTSNKSPSLQQKSKSPVQHHSKNSDQRSKSPPHRNHYSSDRKRLRSSSPDSSVITPLNHNESSNTESISLLKQKKSYRDDSRKKSKHHHRHRSTSFSSSSKSPLSPQTSHNNKKLSESSNEKKPLNSSDNNNSIRHSSKRDDYHPHRYHSSRNYPSTKSSTHQFDRRTTTTTDSNISSLSRIPSNDNSSLTTPTDSNAHETSTEDRNRIYNRLKNANETNTPIAPINIDNTTNNLNKSSSTGSAFINSNGGSQRPRSNLIQIVTTEATSLPTLEILPIRLPPTQVKPEIIQTKIDPIKPLLISSAPAKIESTTTINNSSKSTTIISKSNGNTADDMLMEEMLLEEEQEHSPVKSIDLDSLTIPESLTHKIDLKEDPIKPTTTTAVVTTMITTSAPSQTPSPTKKPYTLYKVPHTNHMTPPLSSRNKKQTKKESSTIQSDLTTINKPSIDDNARRTSLDERISSIFSAPSNKPTNSSTEQQLDTRPNPTQLTTTSTPSDKSTESPQEITSLISTMFKKGHDHSPLSKKLNTNEERRSTTSKHYTSEWLASQKPEEIQTEELTTLPSLVTLPTLVSSQPPINNTKSTVPNSSTGTGETTMIGKLSEAMSKLIQKQVDPNVPPTTADQEDAVPISAKHLERIERRKQREKRQSEIAAIAKEALKPAFKKHDITKDEYKEIMKKVVTKATHANEIDRVRIGKMISAYVDKYRTLHNHHPPHHNTSKTSTNGNG